MRVRSNFIPTNNPNNKQGTGTDNKLSSSSSFCSKFWVLLYFVLFGWIGFLAYFHYLSVIPATELLQSLSSNAAATPASDNKAQSAIVTKPQQEAKPKADQSQQENSSAKENIVVPTHISTDDEIHIVFSTDCSFFQDWQTLVVFHSAILAKQKGKITRIASGCAEDKQKELVDLYHKLYPQYGVHFTPDYKTDGKTKKKYDFYNKPYGLHHWLQKANPPIPSGVVVILIDPDMIILRPLTLDFKNDPLKLYMPGFDPTSEVIPDRIGKGHPAAQLYGLGAPWTYDNHKHFNRKAICGEGSPCLKIKAKFGEQHFSVGPPYFVEKDDLLRLTDSWTAFVPRVYSNYPELLAEMFAYSMAAAHTELPHITMIHYMVSNIDMDEEGWKYIDTFQDDVCEPPVDGLYYPGKPLPNILHYCQFYRSGEIGFQKRRIRKSIFECDKPMLAALPKELGKNRYKNRDGQIMKIGPKQARRASFMLCAVHRTINSMIRYYKEKMCEDPSKINYAEEVNLVDPKYWK